MMASRQEASFLIYPKHLVTLARCLLFKLKQNDISGNLSNVITDFLNQMKQRVVFTHPGLILKPGSRRDSPWNIVLSDLYQQLI